MSEHHFDTPRHVKSRAHETDPTLNVNFEEHKQYIVLVQQNDFTIAKEHWE